MRARRGKLCAQGKRRGNGNEPAQNGNVTRELIPTMSYIANPLKATDRATVTNARPGALAGATVANKTGPVFQNQSFRMRAEAATSLCLAIGNCHPSDACEIMAAALVDLSAGMPIAPLYSPMEAAAFWADLATRAELKAYALACFTRLSKADQAAFLRYVGAAQ